MLVQTAEQDIPPLSRLGLGELARHCRNDILNYRQHGVPNSYSPYGMELFRRAISMRDDDAWACIYQQYAPLVLTWITQHQSAAPILVQEGSDSMVNAAFAKFFQALTPAKIEHFDSLAAILKYLKLCTHSTVADEVRSRKVYLDEKTLELSEHELATDDPADAVVSYISAQGLWQIIQEELNGEDERILAELAFLHRMEPGEISSLHRQRFPSADDAYRLMLVLKNRLANRLQDIVALDHALLGRRELYHMGKKLTYHQQMSFCGKARCCKCREGIGHGPYWYVYRMVDGRTIRQYVGKQLPDDVLSDCGQ